MTLQPKKQFKKATIRDVASRASVSVSTVSQYLSGRESVCSEDTARRITQAVEELNYTPSSFGRGLRGVRTKTVGVFNGGGFDFVYGGIDFIDSPFEPGREYDPFATRLWRGITEGGDRENVQLLLYPNSIQSAVGHNIALLDGSADGIVFLTAPSDERPVNLARRGFPTITVGPPSDPEWPVSAVWTDEFNVMDLALEHLWSLGHRRIAHISGPTAFRESGQAEGGEPSMIAINRLTAFKQWMNERDAFDVCLVRDAQAWYPNYVEPAVRSLLEMENPPTAIVCANDLLALRTMDLAHEMGWKVPTELSIVGIDNMGRSSTSIPALTTVDVDMEEIGREAMAMICSIITSDHSKIIKKALPIGRLIVRASTGPVLVSANLVG